MTWTCCWTDHSKGCPNPGYKKYNHLEKNLDLCRWWINENYGNRFRMGYDKEEKTPAELEKLALKMWEFCQEDIKSGACEA